MYNLNKRTQFKQFMQKQQQQQQTVLNFNFLSYSFKLFERVLYKNETNLKECPKIYVLKASLLLKRIFRFLVIFYKKIQCSTF